MNDEESAEAQEAMQSAEAELDAALGQATQEPEEQQEEQKAPAREGWKKPKGYVETQDPVAEARIKDLWNQVHITDKKNDSLKEYAKQQDMVMNQLLQRFEQLDIKEEKAQYDTAITNLRSQIREARDLGDEDRADKLDQSLTEIVAEKKAKAIVSESKPRPQQQQPQGDPNQHAYVNGLAQERTETGDLRRPWLIAGDRDFTKALNKAAEIGKELEAQGRVPSVYEIMPRLEREMAGKQQKKGFQSSDVLDNSGDLTSGAKGPTMKLDAGQKYTAKKLGLSEDDYRKQVATMTKAARFTRVTLEDVI